MVHENCQQNDDWQRDADQPKQQSTAESHDVLLRFCLVEYITLGGVQRSRYRSALTSARNFAP